MIIAHRAPCLLIVLLLRAVINSFFHGSHQFAGIVISGGNQVNIQGNVIEGLGGPAIVINAVTGVVIQANCELAHAHTHARTSEPVQRACPAGMSSLSSAFRRC